MSKLINEMETHEIITYLKRERYIHGLFYVDRDEVTRKFGIEISDDNTFVQCAIRPGDSVSLVAGTEYVYDVEVKKPAGLPGSGQYEIVQTLLTGKITITDQVSGATSATSGA